MTDYYREFPFEEIRDKNGDYFRRPIDLIELGYKLSQIWSVTENDNTFSYGPPHHVVNVLGFVATKEHHNSKTYYHDEVKYAE